MGFGRFRIPMQRPGATAPRPGSAPAAPAQVGISRPVMPGSAPAAPMAGMKKGGKVKPRGVGCAVKGHDKALGRQAK